MARSSTDPRHVVAPTVVAAGAALMFASSFLPWLQLGPFSVKGYRMANLLIGLGRSGAVGTFFLGVIWYIIPISGALTWLALWSGAGVAVRRTHRWLGLGGFGSAAGVVAWMGVRGFDPGAGAFMALLGGAGVVIAGWHAASSQASGVLGGGRNRR